VAVEIVFYRRACKELRGLPKADCDSVLERLQAYAADPDNPRHAVPALAGYESISRLRAGDWRVLFDRVGDRIEVCIVRRRRVSYR
jgi:mRNA-degrading endonuclease RelE of RelBE toxin-antitoxin system